MSAPACRARPVEPIDVEEVLGRLESVRRNGDGRWMAKCPAHGDKTASLSVRQGDDGRILLHDFGGCSFAEIVAALDVRPEQLFPPSNGPWTPRRPRPDPDREARALLDRLRRLHEPPSRERMRWELEFVGHLILGGPRAFADLPEGFTAEHVRVFPLRLLFYAAVELARQGTPRRRFSPEALWREVERCGGRDKRHDVYFWARAAVSATRRGS